jgi:hypothetical protein
MFAVYVHSGIRLVFHVLQPCKMASLTLSIEVLNLVLSDKQVALHTVCSAQILSLCCFKCLQKLNRL